MICAIFANNTAPQSSNFGNEMILVGATLVLAKSRVTDIDPFMGITRAYKTAEYAFSEASEKPWHSIFAEGEKFIHLGTRILSMLS